MAAVRDTMVKMMGRRKAMTRLHSCVEGEGDA